MAFAGGVLVTALLYTGKLHAPASTEAGVSIENSVNIGRLRADYERRIADLKSQLESVRVRVQNQTNLGKPVSGLEERSRIYQELRKRSVEDYQKEEIDRLLAAGYTMDRIESLRKRTEELAADWIRTEDRLRQQGKADPYEILSHRYDRDIGLRQELGDDEYAKYRQALGRGTGLYVYEPLEGGIAERAGIKSGDEIIAYNGARVFNQGELIPLMGKDIPLGAPVAVDILRNGQLIRLSAESGDLRIRPAVQMYTMEEMLKRVREKIPNAPTR